MPNPINIAQAYHITENHCEAWLLQSLTYWQPKATIVWKHKKWVVRTAREFVEEHGFPFNTETIGKGLRALRSKRLIETRIAPHPVKPAILRATWIRISDETYSQIIPIETIFQSRSKLANHISEESSEKTSEEESTECHYGSSAPVHSSSSNSQESSVGGMGIEATAKENNKNENAELCAKKLYFLFRDCQIETKHVYVPMPEKMSAKSFQKSKTLLSKFKKYSIYEPSQIRDIIRFAVGQWTSNKADTCRLEDLADELGDVLSQYACWIDKKKITETKYTPISAEELTFD